jgi:hypothetical protein
MDIKENFYGKLQQIRESFEQLDEISHKKAREAEDKAAEKYYNDYDAEKGARKKAIRDKTPESKKEAEDAGEKRKKSAKRVIRFQKYADKKKMNEQEQLDELKKSTLASYIKKASHDVATKSAATGRYADRANRARDEMKKGDYKNWPQGKKDDEFADKMFKKSWNRRKGIAKAADKLAK